MINMRSISPSLRFYHHALCVVGYNKKYTYNSLNYKLSILFENRPICSELFSRISGFSIHEFSINAQFLVKCNISRYTDPMFQRTAVHRKLMESGI